MTPSTSLLLLLLLSLCQANPLMEKESGDEAQVDEDDNVDMTERILTTNNGIDGLLWEGDLLVPKTRNAMRCWNKQCRWKKASNGLVIVPYTISNQFTKYEVQKIENAMQDFHSSTCIRFVPRSNEYDYISIVNKGGCWATVGKSGGRQKLSLKRQGCVHHGIIQHELNHALGFWHEQNRSDRDDYVRINWNNIDQRRVHNFKKRNLNNLNTPYDYSSIMHYGKTAFSIQPGRDTITPIPDPNVNIGQKKGLSNWDIKRINLLYAC